MKSLHMFSTFVWDLSILTTIFWGIHFLWMKKLKLQEVKTILLKRHFTCFVLNFLNPLCILYFISQFGYKIFIGNIWSVLDFIRFIVEKLESHTQIIPKLKIQINEWSTKNIIFVLYAYILTQLVLLF